MAAEVPDVAEAEERGRAKAGGLRDCRSRHVKTIAFFNNRGGVGATSLVYHLAWMFAEQGRRVIAADLDPQANLSGMLVTEETMEEMSGDPARKTINDDIAPLFDGTGDIATAPHVEEISERVGLLTGDLSLSRQEDDLSSQWPLCLDGNRRAFRVITALARLICRAGTRFDADLALVDVGPNLGALNRASLVACDHVIIPLAPDLFSVQGLRNVGPTLRIWQEAWSERRAKKPGDLELDLPQGSMQPAGYVIMGQSVRVNRPKPFGRWIEEIPREYRQSVLEAGDGLPESASADPHLLAHLKDYRSLMPLAQEASKPMFMLKPADGAIGGQQAAVQECYRDFRDLALKIEDRIGLADDTGDPRGPLSMR